MDTTVENTKHSPFLTIPAKVISYVFHPLFIPTYIFIFLMKEVPYEFSGITDFKLQQRLFSIF